MHAEASLSLSLTLSLNPRLFSQMAPYDVASNIRQALPNGHWAPPFRSMSPMLDSPRAGLGAAGGLAPRGLVMSDAAARYVDAAAAAAADEEAASGLRYVDAASAPNGNNTSLHDMGALNAEEYPDVMSTPTGSPSRMAMVWRGAEESGGAVEGSGKDATLNENYFDEDGGLDAVSTRLSKVQVFPAKGKGEGGVEAGGLLQTSSQPTFFAVF